MNKAHSNEFSKKYTDKYERILYNYLLLNEGINNKNTISNILYIINKKDNEELMSLLNKVINNENYKSLDINETEEKIKIIKDVVEEFLDDRKTLNKNIKIYNYKGCIKENLTDKEIDIVDDNFMKDMEIKTNKTHEIKFINYDKDNDSIIILEFIKEGKRVTIEKRNRKFFFRTFLNEKFSNNVNEIKNSIISDNELESNNKERGSKIFSDKKSINKENNSINEDKHIIDMSIETRSFIKINKNSEIADIEKLNNNYEIFEKKDNKKEDEIHVSLMILILYKIQNENIILANYNSNKYYFLINKNIMLKLKNEINKNINEDINILIDNFLIKQNYKDFEDFLENKNKNFEDFEKDNINLFKNQNIYNFNKIINKENLLPNDNTLINSINNTQIIFPSNFLLIRTEIYELLIKLFNLEVELNKNLIDDTNQYSLNVFENEIYLININKEEPILYICEISKINNEYQLEDITISYILIYNSKEFFLKEYDLFIKNNGINNYLTERELKRNNNEPQKIINENDENIGFFIQLRKNNDLIIETDNNDLEDNIDNNSIIKDNTNKIKENIDNNSINSVNEKNDNNYNIDDGFNNTKEYSQDNNKENNDNNNNINENLVSDNSKYDDDKNIVIIGLRNSSNNSYVTSLLQCLYNIPELTQYFISNSLFDPDDNENENKDIIDNENNLNKNILNKNSLSFKYAEVIYYLYYKRQGEEVISAYTPTNFINYIQDADPSSFNPKKTTNDPKKLYIFIIENLKKELKKKENIKNIQISKNSSNIGISTPNNDDSYKLYQKFLNNFQFNNNSIIDNYFSGIKSKIKTCQNCNKINSSFKEFYFINFSLSVIEKKIGENQKITLDKCFEYYYYKDNSNINESTKYNCDNCNKNLFSCYKQIFLSPKILVIIIDDVKKKGQLFKLPIKININEYLIEKNEGYQLIGVLAYFKEIGMNEQYFAYCKSNEDENWYCCSDDCIYKIKEDEPINEMENRNRLPYILFYTEIKNNC